MIYSISGLNSRYLGRLSDSWHGHNLSYWTLQHFPISTFDCTPQKQATWIKKRVYLMHHPHLFSPFLGFCAGPRVTRHIHQKAIVDKDQTQMFGKVLQCFTSEKTVGTHVLQREEQYNESGLLSTHRVLQKESMSIRLTAKRKRKSKCNGRRLIEVLPSKMIRSDKEAVCFSWEAVTSFALHIARL